jgi:hypothetical protein
MHQNNHLNSQELLYAPKRCLWPWGKGDIPLHFRFATQLEGLTLKTPTWATPTILLLQDGKELFGRQGYMNPEQFYLVMGKFKLGNSEAFDVAFEASTDAPFCKQDDGPNGKPRYCINATVLDFVPR